VRALKAFAVALVVLGVVAVLAVQAWLNGPIQALDAETVYEVPAGASLSRVTAELAEQGILERPRVLSLWGRLTGQAQNVKAGEYLLTAGLSPRQLLDTLVSGKVRLYPVKIIEGWTYTEVLASLTANSALEAVFDPAADPLQQLQSELARGQSNPEGLLFPDTYMVPRGTSDLDVLVLAAELMQQKLAAAWQGRSEGLPLKNPYELLTLASIVERETAVDDERARVAGVFIRRLQKGMRLQTDPTVIYGLGDTYDGNLTRAHLLTDNPYNTYTRGGLPPTPIGMPGDASLQAVGHPADGKALYFVASGDADGTHVFSATLEEHNAAVAAYIARLRQARRNDQSNE
jgi:UPF0755 protein